MAGQGGETADGRLSPDFREQVRQAFANLTVALAAAFGPAHRPACTLIPVPRLALDGMLFEVAATARVSAPR